MRGLPRRTTDFRPRNLEQCATGIHLRIEEETHSPCSTNRSMGHPRGAIRRARRVVEERLAVLTVAKGRPWGTRLCEIGAKATKGSPLARFILVREKSQAGKPARRRMERRMISCAEPGAAQRDQASKHFASRIRTQHPEGRLQQRPSCGPRKGRGARKFGEKPKGSCETRNSNPNSNATGQPRPLRR